MDIQEIKDKWRLLEIAPIFVETQASQSGSTVIFPVDVLKKRWAKYGNGQPVKALTQNCEDVSDFIEAIKQKMQRKLDGVDPDEISLQGSENEDTLEPDFELMELASGPAGLSAKTPGL